MRRVSGVERGYILMPWDFPNGCIKKVQSRHALGTLQPEQPIKPRGTSLVGLCPWPPRPTPSAEGILASAPTSKAKKPNEIDAGSDRMQPPRDSRKIPLDFFAQLSFSFSLFRTLILCRIRSPLLVSFEKVSRA